MNNEIYEIERKFLVNELPQDLCKYEHHIIQQGYISTNPTIRIRQLDDKYILTVKGAGKIQRIEYELELTEEQFNGLKAKVEGNTISKTRYIIPINEELKAELDIYSAQLDGFMNVEVEFKSLKEALLFEPPAWFGQEVTQDKRYTNGSLSRNGIPK
jgi:CYTH domain-containing protein